MLAQGDGGPEDADDPDPGDDFEGWADFWRSDRGHAGEDRERGMKGGESIAWLVGEDQPLVDEGRTFGVDGFSSDAVGDKEEDDVREERGPENASDVALIVSVIDAQADPAEQAVEREVEPQAMKVDRDREVEGARFHPKDFPDGDLLEEAVGDDDPEHEEDSAGGSLLDRLEQIGWHGRALVGGLGSGVHSIWRWMSSMVSQIGVGVFLSSGYGEAAWRSEIQAHEFI